MDWGRAVGTPLQQRVQTTVRSSLHPLAVDYTEHANGCVRCLFKYPWISGRRQGETTRSQFKVEVIDLGLGSR